MRKRRSFCLPRVRGRTLSTEHKVNLPFDVVDSSTVDVHCLISGPSCSWIGFEAKRADALQQLDIIPWKLDGAQILIL